LEHASDVPDNGRLNQEGFIRINPQQRLSDPHAFLLEEDLQLTTAVLTMAGLALVVYKSNSKRPTTPHQLNLTPLSNSLVYVRDKLNKQPFGVFASCHLFDHR
jgi:hypothetical protein